MKKLILGIAAAISLVTAVGTNSANASPTPSTPKTALVCNTPTYYALAGTHNGDGWFDMCANAMTVHDYVNDQVTAFFYVYLCIPGSCFDNNLTQEAVMAPPGGWVTKDYSSPYGPKRIRKIQPCVVFPYGNNPYTIVCDQQIAVPEYTPY
jgi:hypothetical protein